MYTYNAAVTKVTDGDTVWMDIDLGFYVHVNVPVRLASINAPELSTSEGKAAKQYLSKLLDESADVVVVTTKKGTEKYGRWLATLTTTTHKLSINERMVLDGHAVPYMV
jgi:micrococcal nuclease